MITNLLSVLIPCYNGHEYLNTCLNCILEQNYDDIEVIIVNDGSSDNSEEIILSYEERFSERGFIFNYINQENQGAAGAINNALKVCQGEFIVLYDVDDFLYPHSYSTMVNYLKDHPEYGMVQCNGYFVTPSNLNDTSRLFVKDEAYHSKNYFEDYLFGKTHNWPSSYMLRAENLFDTLVNKDIYVSPYGQNLQVILPVAYKYKVGYIHEPLMRYLVRDNSVSHPKDFNTMVKLFSGFEENKVETIKRIVDMSENSKQKYITDAMVESYIMRLVYAFQKLEKKYYIKEYKQYKRIAKPAFSFRVKNFLFHVPFMTSVLKAIKK